MIRIAKLTDWSVRYYESTAVRGHEHAGGLSEYYTERDTRAPVVLVAGDREFATEAMGVEHEAGITQEDVTRWFGDGVAPSGAAPSGRGAAGRMARSIPGYDVLITVPKSVSLQAALATEPGQAETVMQCVLDAAQEALGYLHQHAGYTRVASRLYEGKKDLQRLPSLPFVAYVHHTSRPAADGTCDPHMHIHALLPGKIAREDGRMVSIDSVSMYHEAKAAGMVFQKSMRDRLSAALGIDWGAVDPHTGIAEIKGYDRDTVKAWSRRSSALLEWAQENLDNWTRLDDPSGPAPTAAEARTGLGWLDAAQKATRNKKLESLRYDELRERWQNDPRAESMDVSAFVGVVAGEAAKHGPGEPPTAAAVFELLGAVKNNWTRADMVEAVVGLWGPGRGQQVVSVADIEARVEEITSEGCFQTVENAKSWHREGHVRYTDAITLQRESDVMMMGDITADHYMTPATKGWFDKLSHGADEVMAAIANSQRFINVLEAPAGSGKTTSLGEYRKLVEAQGRRLVLGTAQRKALDEARQAGAASEYDTLAAIRKRINDATLDWDRKTAVVIDEAAMAGDRDIYEVLKAAKTAGSKVVLVGDSHQLQPVRAGGGLFRDLSEQLPWTQSFDYVWRQKDAEEKAATLDLRHAQTETQANKVAAWYANHDRLRAGDARSMADELVLDYFDQASQDRDVLVIGDQWEMVDALNLRIQRITNLAYQQHGHDLGAAVPIARDQHARYGDIIMTKENTWDIPVTPDPAIATLTRETPGVTNADRWRVLGVDATNGTIEAQRLSDHARAILPADYAQHSVVLGYAGTIHAAQGANADVGLAIGDAEKMTKTMLYPAMTRGSILNRIYMTVPVAGEDEHHTSSSIDAEPTVYSTREAQAMLAGIIGRDDREHTALAEAEHALDRMRGGEEPHNYLDHFDGMDPYVADLAYTRTALRETRTAEHIGEQLAREREAADTGRVRQQGRHSVVERDGYARDDYDGGLDIS